MKNTTYRVNVTSPGLTLIYRNRVIRTPVRFEAVYESELSILELQLKQKSMEYSTEKNTLISKTDEPISDQVIEENEEVQIEELHKKDENKPESILDKLIAEDE